MLFSSDKGFILLYCLVTDSLFDAGGGLKATKNVQIKGQGSYHKRNTKSKSKHSNRGDTGGETGGTLEQNITKRQTEVDDRQDEQTGSAGRTTTDSLFDAENFSASVQGVLVFHLHFPLAVCTRKEIW